MNQKTSLKKDSSDTTDFTFSEPCIVIHIREKDQKDATLSQFIPIKFFPLHVSNKHIHHQEVISVHAANSISHASTGCLAADMI